MSPAYSAHLNADTATLNIRQTFQIMSISILVGLSSQPAIETKQSYANSNFETSDLNTYNVYQYQHQHVVRLLFLCIYNIILQLKQVSQPLKYEKEDCMNKQ